MLQYILRQFFSFFMPLLQRQLYRDFCFSASVAFLHSSLASRPVTLLKLVSFPATHWRRVLYLALHSVSFRHCSLAFTQSSLSPDGRRFTSADRTASAAAKRDTR
ncbi:hypothetical protein GDO81_028702 [Engystomops pustulosus]|uniref:Transmembrane protein n=1 Tax=Engystomops pustulosus TaxID=76066 RepID=A0AAV6YCX9_ENGPU|nr:hypothetical protein GDO81_028702 [Engystomops pustulosus]